MLTCTHGDAEIVKQQVLNMHWPTVVKCMQINKCDIIICYRCILTSDTFDFVWLYVLPYNVHL